MEQSTEFRIEQVLSRVSHLVGCGAITDPVVSAYLVSLQQRVDHDQPIDSVTVAQFEYLADVLEKVPDP